MRKILRYFFLSIAAVTGLGLVSAVIGLAVAMATLPASPCRAGEQQVEKLSLMMNLDDVRAILGCDGAHLSKEDFGEIQIETISWRGDAWPYARFDGTFINGKMHGTSKIWLNLKLSANTG